MSSRSTESKRLWRLRHPERANGVRHRLKVLRRCPWCLREFHPWVRAQMYCDRYCRSQHSVGKRGRGFWTQFQRRGNVAQGRAA